MTATIDEKRLTSNRVTTGLAFGFTAALAYGTSQVMTRYGLADLAPPLVGSLIALFCGTLGFAAVSARSLGRNGRGLRRGAVFFAGAGVFSSIGVMLMFQALDLGQVVVISPVVATNPLFTLLFAALLLRGVERIPPRTVLGALLVVAGVGLLAAA